MAFPTLPSGYLPDARQFSQSVEDPTLRTELEGGYVATRLKHTRTPRKSWQVAYQMLTDADKLVLDDYYETVTGAVIFDWTNPSNDIVYQVRFKSPIEWRYAGIGYTRRWDCSFSVEQA